jgi:integrase
MRLNDKTVTPTSAPKLPAGKSEYIFFDDSLKGFGLRVREGGAKTWVYQYKFGKHTRRWKIGTWPALSASAARYEVTKPDGVAVQVASGRDPVAEKKKKTDDTSDTFENISALYLAAKTKRLKPRSYIEIERHLIKHAKPLHKLPVDALSQRDVAELFAAIASESGLVTSNRVRSSVAACLTWAMKMGRAKANPAAFTVKEDEKERMRVLSDDEMAKVWNALPQGDYGDICRLLMLTGLRKSEVGDLQFSEIDMQRGTITLPPERVKNGREHVIFMSAPVREILDRKEKTQGRDYVFGFGNGGFSGWSRCKERLDAALGKMSGWVIHDIRRSVASGMGDLGIAPHVIEQCLNHASGTRAGIASVYNKSKYEKETREALTLWADHVSRIISKRCKAA